MSKESLEWVSIGWVSKKSTGLVRMEYFASASTEYIGWVSMESVELVSTEHLGWGEHEVPRMNRIPRMGEH